jgi:hypothetical protein
MRFATCCQDQPQRVGNACLRPWASSLTLGYHLQYVAELEGDGCTPKRLDAVIEDALVITQRLGLPEDERRLTDGPLRLPEEPDMTELRKRLTNRRAQIGQRSDARRDGNTTKRHHLKELSAVGAGYEVDPLEDLGPVCPNCHAMLHKRHPAFTPQELRLMLRRSPAGPL